jgi:hypothetical protein
MVQHTQIYKCNDQINKSKDKNHMTISRAAEKASGKIQHPFMIKALKKLRLERIYLNIIKVVFDKTIGNIVLYGQN